MIDGLLWSLSIPAMLLFVWAFSKTANWIADRFPKTLAVAMIIAVVFGIAIRIASFYVATHGPYFASGKVTEFHYQGEGKFRQARGLSLDGKRLPETCWGVPAGIHQAARKGQTITVKYDWNPRYSSPCVDMVDLSGLEKSR